MKIKILADDVRGSESGQENKAWEKGAEYDVSEGFARVLIEGGLAEEVKGGKKDAPKDEKQAGKPEKSGNKKKDAPESKEIKDAPENK